MQNRVFKTHYLKKNKEQTKPNSIFNKTKKTPTKILLIKHNR